MISQSQKLVSAVILGLSAKLYEPQDSQPWKREVHAMDECVGQMLVLVLTNLGT